MKTKPKWMAEFEAYHNPPPEPPAPSLYDQMVEKKERRAKQQAALKRLKEYERAIKKHMAERREREKSKPPKKRLEEYEQAIKKQTEERREREKPKPRKRSFYHRYYYCPSIPAVTYNCSLLNRNPNTCSGWDHPDFLH